MKHTDKEKFCEFHHYIYGWKVGTGIRVSLAPGKYRITAEEQIDGRMFLKLDNSYRIDAEEFFEKGEPAVPTSCQKRE